MIDSTRSEYLNLSTEIQWALIAAARDANPVRGLTHGYYKYPARFSPAFASTAIRAFTNEGDLVLDPHVGGGTTIVEALAAGRDAVGIDISSLAEFVSTVKCMLLSDPELTRLACWARDVIEAIDIHRPSTSVEQYKDLGYYKHLNHPSRWRLRKAIDQALASAQELGSPRLELFGRCAVLRTAQWALDGRRKSATVSDFRRTLELTAEDMIAGARELRTAASATGWRKVKILCRSAAGLEYEWGLHTPRAPKLVVTSPPYPGVHVLYHRWQVDGRKEAPLPFMIANKLDGAGSSYYTMGDRKNPELKSYFANIRASMSSVAALADRNTIVVQMIAFSEPQWQLARYLQTMQEAGLSELFLGELKTEGDGRLWRNVPGRRWYSAQRGTTPGSLEVVLFHRKL